MKRDRKAIAEALAKMTPADRADLEVSVLHELARTGTPIRRVVETPNGPVEMSSRVVTAHVPDGYSGPAVVRVRRLSSDPGLSDLALGREEVPE